MDEIITPLRSEDIIDPLTGKLSIRYAVYFEDLQNRVNETTVNVESAEGALSEVPGLVAAPISEFQKALEEVDSLATSLQNANARIAELQKQVNNLDQLVPL